MLGKSKVFETTTPRRDVFGDFNGKMADAFLVIFNELSKAEIKGCSGKMKALITDESLIINRKGSNQYEIRSHHRSMITTNNPDPVNTSKDDRRNLIIRGCDDMIGNKEYFEE